jgi:tetratricopeptide (TPR) repeat protein
MRLALGDVHTAIDLGAQLVAAAGTDPQRRTLALVAHAHARAYAGGLDEAVAMLTDAARICEDAGLEHRRGLVAGAMVQPLLRLGRTQDACTAAERAVASAREPIEEAKALVSLGAVLRMLGRRDGAIAALERAGRLAAGSDAIAAAARSNLAECMLDADRFDEAIAGFEQAATAFDACGRPHAAAICRGNVADVLGRLGRVDDASAAFERARRSFESGGAVLDVARLHIEEGEMLAQAGALRMARDRSAHALPILEQANAEAELARARASLGLVLVRLGDPAGARRVLAQAAAHPLHAELPGLRAEVGIALAWCDLMESDAASAVRRAEGVLALGDLTRSVRTRALLARGEAALHAGRHAGAAADARTASDIARTAGLRALLPLCEDLLGRALPDADAALDALTRAATTAADVLGSARSDAGAGGLRHLYRPIFARAAAALGARPGYAGDAFTLLERADGGARTRGRAAFADAATPAAERIEAALARAYARAGAFGVGGGGGGGGDDAAVLTLELESQLHRERAGAGASIEESATWTAEHLAAALRPDDAMVRFWSESDHVHALVVRRDGTHACMDVARLSTCLSGARRLSFLAERAGESAAADAWLQSARALGALLFAGPGPALAGVGRVFIGASPELEGLPWNLLGSVTLGPGVGVCAVRSASDVDADHAPTSAGHAPACVALAPDDPSLPGAPDECARVAAIWNGQALLGGTTADALDAIAQADIVHLATHGVFAPDRPGASRLLIGDGWVTVSELTRRLRPGSLLVLAACHAGRAGGLAEDRAALPRAFLDAGAGAVIAPLWPISDASAGDFAVGLHTRIRAGWGQTGSVSRALGASVVDAASNRCGSPDAAGAVLWGGGWC